MDKAQKTELVNELTKTLPVAAVVVAARYRGLTVADMADLRSQLKDVGGVLKVAKNRLVKIAVQNTPAEPLCEFLTDQTVLAWAEDDPVAVPKILVKYKSANPNLVVVGGVRDGQLMNSVDVEVLSKTPSLDELRGTLVGLIQEPAARIARLLNEPGRRLACIAAARSEQ